MSVFRYLYVTELKNQIKKALKKPITYFYMIVIAFYVASMCMSMRNVAQVMGVSGEESVSIILSGFVVFFLPMNILTYSKRKGIAFRQSDVHLLFPMPVSPKKMLIYVFARNNIMLFLIGLFFLVPIGVFGFHVSAWKMLCYFFLYNIVENFLEGSLMLILYGSETISRKTIQGICFFLKCILIVFLGYAVYLAYQEGVSVEFVSHFIKNPVVQCVPLIGWILACIQFIFIGSTAVNSVCFILYLFLAAFLIFLAARMECSGDYFEDAMKFADDYAEARRKGKKGEASFIGKKQKFGKANVTYQGKGARALYYRQLLEYKKQKYFIFGPTNLIYLAAGLVSAFLIKKSDGQIYCGFILCGIGAYMIILMSGFMTKWKKELCSPYTFMIPDSDLRKLWYSTVIEHIRSITNAVLFILPSAFYFKMNYVTVFLCMLLLFCLSTNKIYTSIVTEAILGNTLGTMAKQMLHLIFQSVCIGFGVAGGLLGNLLSGPDFGFMLMIVTTAILTFAAAVLASTQFGRMEHSN